MTNKIFVGNISYGAVASDLESAFAGFGEIQDIKIAKDRVTGKSRGFGFVTFTSADDAKKALTMDGKELDGRKIRVNVAREKQPASES